jgi:peptidoglycan/xylan/chitin deacetylase (PgdA/CDA1 family)
VPSFLEYREMLDRWSRLPGTERVEGARARAVLSFDDGPDPDSTPAVLDALDEAGAKATFFVVGEQLMRHQAIAREALARGHELELHGFEHRPHDELSPREARDDLARGLGALEAATGLRARRYRPPYGLFSEASHAACGDLELEPVYWSGWGMDWEPIPGERIAELAARDLRPGAIVLLHDSARYATRPSALPSAEAVPLIAAAAGDAGLELTTLGAAAAPS